MRLQLLGSLGIRRDTVVERIFRDTRAFRIHDGRSEAHRRAPGARPLVSVDRLESRLFDDGSPSAEV
jgi:alkylation response protein AidB-like acyl-CoA dehydrogenase